MVNSVTEHFPSDWLVTIVVERSAGRDAKGIPTATTEHTIHNCLVASDESEEFSRTDSPDTTAAIYAPRGADIISTDRLRIPPGAGWITGKFQVTGRPAPWPYGVRATVKEI